MSLSSSLSDSLLLTQEIHLDIDASPNISTGHVFGKYDKIGDIGTMGSIILGITRDSTTRVVIKIINRKTLLKRKEANLFREVTALQKLRHESIVELKDFYEASSETDNYYYIVLEYMEGGHLLDRIAEKQLFSELEARATLTSIIKALCFCHDNRVIHRDLKPENIYLSSVDNTLNVKLLGFGYSVIDNGEHIIGEVIPGNSLFQAPDAFAGKAVDMWSLGVIAYRLIGGHPLFTVNNKEHVLKALASSSDGLNFDKGDWSNVSSQAKDFVTSLLAINPADRMTAHEALVHPWLTSNDVTPCKQEPLDNTDIEIPDFALMSSVVGSVYDVRDSLGSPGSILDVRLAIKRSTLDIVVLKIIERYEEPPVPVVSDDNNLSNEEEDYIMRENAVDSLMREIEITQTLSHDNIIQCFESYDEPNYFAVAFEFMAGGRLFERMLKKTHFNEKEARDMVKQLVRAIDYCHSRNIVHRDIKPENILLVQEGNDEYLKLTDFASAVHDENGAGEISGSAGSLLFVAPEILKKRPYGKAVDMWSLGVVVYFLLGGYYPFEALTDRQLVKLVKKGEYEFHTEYWKEASDDAKDFIARLLVVDPRNRMSSFDALQHPWLTSEVIDNDLSSTLATLKKLNAKRRLKAAIRAIIVSNKFRIFMDQAAKESLAATETSLKGSMVSVSLDSTEAGPPAASAASAGNTKATDGKASSCMIL